MFEVVYHYLAVEEDIPKLDNARKAEIKRAIEERLMTAPDMYGKPLRRSLKGYRNLRAGDYRVIYRIEDDKVRIFAIKHHLVIYETAEKRI